MKNVAAGKAMRVRKGYTNRVTRTSPHRGKKWPMGRGGKRS